MYMWVGKIVSILYMRVPHLHVKNMLCIFGMYVYGPYFVSRKKMILKLFLNTLKTTPRAKKKVPDKQTQFQRHNNMPKIWPFLVPMAISRWH